MELKYLGISKNASYEADPSGYKGEVEFVSKSGKISINLDNEFSKQVLVLVAESLVEASRRLGKTLTSEVLKASDLLSLGDSNER